MSIQKYEFQPSIYLLSNETSDENMSENIRFKLIQRIGETYNEDQAQTATTISKKFDSNDKQYIYGMLPVELIPAAYIPFRYDDIEANFYRLSKNDKIKDQSYKTTFEKASSEDGLKTIKTNLKEELKVFLKHKLSGSGNTFYTVEIESIMLYEILLFWLILLIIIMKILYTYYSSVYSYIIFSLFAIVLLIAIFWKMFYTLQ